MPEPVDLYQSPAGSTPASFQSSSSFLCVPESSPREAKEACLSAIAFSAAATSVEPFTPAGSAAGPTTTKSLYMTSFRCTPNPSATNFFSAAGAWTKTTSASPRDPVSSAWPVPCAMTRTSMPVFSVNFGRRYSNRPDASVEVVDATVMNFSCASAPCSAIRGAAAASAAAKARAR